MKNFISFAIRLLSIAVIGINLYYLKQGKPLSFSSWASSVEPILIACIAAIVIASVVLMFLRTSGGMIRLVLLLLILAVTFPLYHPYLLKLKALIP